jgi:hypothetical protein
MFLGVHGIHVRATRLLTGRVLYELPHRGLMEFASEQLPFKRFTTNQAHYYLMLLNSSRIPRLYLP